MSDCERKKAVEYINSVANTVMVKSACERALRDGSDKAMTAALVTAREAGQQLVVKNAANKALGMED